MTTSNSLGFTFFSLLEFLISFLINAFPSKHLPADSVFICCSYPKHPCIISRTGDDQDKKMHLIPDSPWASSCVHPSCPLFLSEAEDIPSSSCEVPQTTFPAPCCSPAPGSVHRQLPGTH